jgi:hypothetical protein
MYLSLAVLRLVIFRIWRIGLDQNHGLINYKDTKTKCRLYWCLLELTDWRYIQSFWHFDPALWTITPLTSLVHLPPFPKSNSNSCDKRQSTFDSFTFSGYNHKKHFYYCTLKLITFTQVSGGLGGWGSLGFQFRESKITPLFWAQKL